MTTVRNPAKGLRCAGCGGQTFRVLACRAVGGNMLKRYRKCLACGRRLTTWEVTAGQLKRQWH